MTSQSYDLEDIDSEPDAVSEDLGPGVSRDVSGVDTEPVSHAASGDVVPFRETGSAKVSATASGDLSDVAEPAFPDRVSAAVELWAGNARAGVERFLGQPGGPWRAIWYGHSESMAEHAASVIEKSKNRAIIPAAAGAMWAVTFGVFFHLTGEWWKACRYPSVFFASLAFIGLVVLIINVVT